MPFTGHSFASFAAHTHVACVAATACTVGRITMPLRQQRKPSDDAPLHLIHCMLLGHSAVPGALIVCLIGSARQSGRGSGTPATPPATRSAPPGHTPHARRVPHTAAMHRWAGRETAPQRPDWSGETVGTEPQSTPYKATSVRGIFTLSSLLQEYTIGCLFRNMAQALKFGVEVALQRLNIVHIVQGWRRE